MLGTSLTIQATVESKRFARSETVRTHIESLVLREVDRLAAVFSVFDPQSELRRWRAIASSGTRHEVSFELAQLLARSADWQQSSGGAYNPGIGHVVDRWRAAEHTGVVPSNSQTDRWATELGRVPYVVTDRVVTCLDDCTGLSFNSFAKGHIADRAAAILSLASDGPIKRVEGVTINLGGDLRTIHQPRRVGVEHPTRPFDNEPPLVVIEVCDAGVATSGSSRRPIKIGDQVFSHLIDPRTCRPVTGGPASATVVAADAATADVLATIVAVTGVVPEGVAAAIARPDGRLEMTDSFSLLVMRLNSDL